MRSFFLALPLTLIAVSVLAQAPATPPPPDELPASEVAVPADGEKSTTGLVSKLIRKGSSNEKAEATDVVTVHYTGWSSEGRLFDSSVVRGPASTFPLDKVMAGWRECVQLMTLGEKRRCWIPENLAYKGQAGRPKGTVMFDIELIDRRGNPLIAPPDVKSPPDDAKRTPTGLAYKVMRVAKACGIRAASAALPCTTPAGRRTDACSTARSRRASRPRSGSTMWSRGGRKVCR